MSQVVKTTTLWKKMTLWQKWEWIVCNKFTPLAAIIRTEIDNDNEYALRKWRLEMREFRALVDSGDMTEEEYRDHEFFFKPEPTQYPTAAQRHPKQTIIVETKVKLPTGINYILQDFNVDKVATDE